MVTQFPSTVNRAIGISMPHTAIPRTYIAGVEILGDIALGHKLAALAIADTVTGQKRKVKGHKCLEKILLFAIFKRGIQERRLKADSHGTPDFCLLLLHAIFIERAARVMFQKPTTLSVSYTTIASKL